MDKIEKAEKLFEQIADMLPCVDDNKIDNYEMSQFVATDDGTMILSTEESEIETIANLFDQLADEGICTTGYYDPEEDKRNNEVTVLTGLYYVSIV